MDGIVESPLEFPVVDSLSEESEDSLSDPEYESSGEDFPSGEKSLRRALVRCLEELRRTRGGGSSSFRLSLSEEDEVSDFELEDEAEEEEEEDGSGSPSGSSGERSRIPYTRR